MSWAEVGIIGTLVVSLSATLFGFIQANRSNKSASTSKTIELGITTLIDQYQEANAVLSEGVKACKDECKALKTKVELLEKEVSELKTQKDDHEVEIIRLKIKTGEI